MNPESSALESDADRARLDQFERGHAIEVDWRKIEKELALLWRAAARRTPGRVVSRATLWNLLAIAPTDEDGLIAYRALIDRLSSEVACRAIGLREVAGTGESIRAWVEANWRHLPGQWNGSDEVLLVGEPSARRRLESLAASLIVSDASTALAALGRFDPDRVVGLVDRVDRLLLDSRPYDRPDELCQLAEWIGMHPLLTVVDLSWMGISPLRGLVASFFDRPDEVRQLDQLQRVVIATSVDGLPVRALLFLGWLGSRLGWTNFARAGGDLDKAPRWSARTRTSRTVNLEIERDTGAHHGVTRVELFSSEGAWALQRKEIGISVVGPNRPPRIQPLRRHSDADLVAAGLGPRGSDPVYRPALDFVADLLRVYK